MNRAYLRRRAGGFTLIELLMAASITVILAGIASDLFIRIQTLVSMGAANTEVTNDAAAMERVLRNDFRALNTQGFLAIRWSDQPVVDLARPQITGGVITGVTINYQGSNFSTANLPSIVIYDPTGSGTGAVATATLNPNGNGIAGIKLTSGGSGYSASTIVIVGGVPADQIVFFAGGPWVTANYYVQDLTAGTNSTFSEANLFQNTFTTDIARIYYGHLASTNDLSYAVDNSWCFNGGALMNQSTLSAWQWRLGRQAMLLTDDDIESPAPPSGSGNYLATQSIWQTTNNTTPLSGLPAYGVQPGQSDITELSDLTLIRQSVLTSSPPAPSSTYVENDTVNGWAGATYAQRMAQSCLRIYGTPSLNPTTPLNLSTILSNTPVLVPNCSSFQVQPTVNTMFTDVVRPGGAVVLVTTDASGPGHATGAIPTANTTIPPAGVYVLAGGQGYSGNVLVTLPNPPIYTPWSSIVNYAPSNPVTYNGNDWVCITANINQVPSLGSAYWQITQPAVLLAHVSSGAISSITVLSTGSGYPPYTTFPALISDCYCSGYNLGTSNGCQAWPKLIQVTATLQDQLETIHNYSVSDPTLPDGRLYRFTLEVPQQ